MPSSTLIPRTFSAGSLTELAVVPAGRDIKGGVLGSPRMPVLTRIASHAVHVLGVGHRLQMVRVGTQSDSAHVVKFDAFGKRATLAFPYHPVDGASCPAAVYPLTDQPITVSKRHGSGPKPAPCFVVNDESRAGTFVSGPKRSSH